MAATGKSFSCFFFLCIIHLSFPLYEDQAGTFDWRQQYVGRVTHLYWEQQPGTSGGKRILVSSDKNVIGAITTVNGEIGCLFNENFFYHHENNYMYSLEFPHQDDSRWRKVFEEGPRGRIDNMLYNGEVLVTILGGRRVSSWSPATGNLNWEVYLPGLEEKRGYISFTSEKSKGMGWSGVVKVSSIVSHWGVQLVLAYSWARPANLVAGGMVVALTAEGAFGLSLKDGSQKWDITLADRDSVDSQNVLVHDGTVYIVTITMGSEVKITAADLEGSILWTKTVMSAWLDASTKCVIVQNQYLMCYCGAMESFQVLNLQEPKAFVATSVQDLGVGKERIDVENWAGQFSPTANGVMVKLAADHSVLLTLSDSGHFKVKKNLPGSLSAALITYDDRDYILSIERSGHEELTLLGYDVTSGEELSELGHKIHYVTHNGLPADISGLLARKKDGKMAYKMAILSQDYSLQVIHKTGKLAWRREESVAYSVAVEMVDLPVSENQAKFEDEFGSHEDNILTMFVKRIKTQLSQLKTFIVQQVHRLSGIKHHHAVFDDLEAEDDDDEDLLRDDFSLNKMIILVTSAGKVIGMKSMNGHIAWQHLIPNLMPFNRFGKEKLLLYIQRTTAHFPHPPQCVVLGRNKKTGQGHLFAFNPITGALVEDIPSDGLHLDFNVVQSFMLGEMDEQFLRGVVMVDDSLKVHTYPKTIRRFVEDHANSLFLYVATPETGLINGYRIAARDNMLFVDNVWNINLQKKQQTITNIVSKRPNEHVHSQGRVLGDRSVLYKYLNPNVIMVTTEGEEIGSTQTKGYNFINVYIIDVVTGHIVFHGNHRRSKGPVHVVHSENWAVYNYYNMKQRRHEMAVLEMFEGKEQSNATSFSSFTAPAQPLVMRQSFIFPMPLYTMAATITEKGITSKNIIVALKNGGLFSLPKAFLDPRRPLMPTQETMEEGTLPYIPELPVHTEGIINYNQTLQHIRGIYTAPAGLESTSLVLSYGLDLFHTRVQPSKMFDVLKEDFEYWLIACVLGVMLLVSVVSQKLAGRRALVKAWK